MIELDPRAAAEAAKAQRAFGEAIDEITGSGMASLVTLATMQALRFTVGNIEVDTGRTVNSISRKGSNANIGILSTNVSYAPFVRDASHSEQFFRYAERVEGPNIRENFGMEVQARVNRAFQ